MEKPRSQVELNEERTMGTRGSRNNSKVNAATVER